MFVNTESCDACHCVNIEVCCSFNSIVGGMCEFDTRDRRKETQIIPLFACSKAISNYTASLGFSGPMDEVDLILSRAAVFTQPANITSMTICPLHEILENLDAQALLVAMTFLPRKFRESQSDWFGKRGIPWHISLAVTRIAPLFSPLLMTSFVNLRKSYQKSTLFICGAIRQDAIIARLHYFQSTMLPTSMQLN